MSFLRRSGRHCYYVALCLSFALLFGIELNAQTIQSVDPDSAVAGSTVNITLTGMGTNFQPGTTTLIMGSNNFPSSSEQINSSTETVATIAIPASAPTGWYDVDKDGVTMSAGFWIGPCVGSCGTISGTVWDDVNGNGIQDGGELGLSGFTVTLMPAGDVTTTDGAGNYQFYTETGVTYTVSVDAGVYNAPCWTSGPQNGSVNFPVSGTHSVTLTGANPNSSANDFGLDIPNTSCQIVSIDPDSVLPGATVTVTVLGLGTQFQSGTTTISLGANSYSTQIETIVSNTEYTAELTIPSNAPYGAYDFIKDNVTAPASFHVVPCTSCGQVSGTVWNDANGNGVQDVSEVGEPGVEVTVSPFGFTDITDAAGDYDFSLPIGQSYTVTMTTPTVTAPCWQGNTQPTSETYPGSGHTVTLSVANPDSLGVDFGISVPNTSCTIVDVSPDTVLVGTTVDIDFTGLGTMFMAGSTTLYDGTTTITSQLETITSNTEYSANVTIPSNATVGWYTLDKDGIIHPNAVYVTSCIGNCGTISGMVWHDENANGILDGVEQPMQGINITANPGGFGAVTDASGAYSFSVPDTTTYTVTMDAGTYTAVCSGTFQLAGSQSTPVGPFSIPLSPTSNTSTGNDFGLVIPDTTCGTIEGHVYKDANGNGIEDAGDVDWAGAQLQLMPGSVVITTDANGDYSFDVLKDSTYTVELVSTSANLTCAGTNQSYAATQTEPVVGGYTTSVSTVAPNSLGNNFGSEVPVACAVFTGSVFTDHNQNGVQDGGEPLDTDAWILNVTNNSWHYTGADGEWEFAGHYDTNYEFQLDLPQYNWGCNGVNVGPSVQTLPAANANITQQVVSGSSQATGLDFGIYNPDTQCGSLSGIVYNDLNGNGVQDAGEPALHNVKVIITGGGTTCFDYTNAQGYWSMVAPLNVTYTVSVQPTSNGSTYFCTQGYVANTGTVTEPVATTYSVSPSGGMPDLGGLNFGIEYTVGANVADARISTLWMNSGNLPGETFYGGCDFKINVTAGVANCTLRVSRDPAVNFLGMHHPNHPTPDVIGANFNTWYLPNLSQGYYSYCFMQDCQIDPGITPGTYIEWEAEVWCDATDPCPINNNEVDLVYIYNPNRSFVPDLNQMEVTHAGDSATDEISPADSSFSYVIVYQNTTGDTVHSLTIRDTLPPELDPATVSSPFSTHPHEFYVIDNVLHFEFDSIMLTDTSQSRYGSYGYVQYNVKMRPDLDPGTVIPNQATMYFNDTEVRSVVSDNVTIVGEDGTFTIDRPESLLRVYPNPARTQLNVVHTNGAIYNAQLVDMVGKVVMQQQLNGEVVARFDVEGLTPGMYMLRIDDGVHIENRPVIIQR